MLFETTIERLRERVRQSTFAVDGDGVESSAAGLLVEEFPNFERFWQFLIVPLTTRIEFVIGDPAGLRQRDVSPDLRLVSYLHYSVFLHLLYSFDHLADAVDRRKFEPSAFGDFYTHLGSACDLAEDFLLRAYLLVLECHGRPSLVMQQLTREEFCEMAGRWYDCNYARTFQHYSSKGKVPPVRLPNRGEVINEYLGASAAWREYKTFTQRVREYRNVVVHDVAMGAVHDVFGRRLVPRKEKIQEYRGLIPVLEAASHPERLRRDFVVMEEQMADDLKQLERLFDQLWVHPLEDLSRLLYEEPNRVLLDKYQIHFVD